MEDDTKACTDCILALKKKATETDKSYRSCHPLKRGPGKFGPETNYENN